MEDLLFALICVVTDTAKYIFCGRKGHTLDLNAKWILLPWSNVKIKRNLINSFLNKKSKLLNYLLVANIGSAG